MLARSTTVNTCPNCNHENRAGVLICEHCGQNIFDRIFTSTRRITSAARQSRPLASIGTQRLGISKSVIMRIADAPTPIKCDPKTPLTLGRINANNPRRPDIDLTTYRAFEKGVSCRHATLQRQEDRLMIADMGSTNGTFVNGQRLNPHEPRVLRDGDEIRLGNLFVRIAFGSTAQLG